MMFLCFYTQSSNITKVNNHYLFLIHIILANSTNSNFLLIQEILGTLVSQLSNESHATYFHSITYPFYI